MSKISKEMIARLMDREGGYVNDPVDPGGETNHGLSKRQYPTLDIKHLTREQAAVIYERDYLKATHIDQIRFEPLREQLFDFAVHSGPPQAIKTLQRLLYVKPDGLLGLESLQVINTSEAIPLNNGLVEARLQFLDNLVNKRPKLAKFQKGWRRRAASFSIPDARD